MEILERIYCAIDQHCDSPRVQEAAWYCVYSFAHEPQGPALLVATGVMHRLCESLRQHYTVGGLVLSICDVIKRLALSGPAGTLEVASSDAVRLLYDLAEGGITDAVLTLAGLKSPYTPPSSELWRASLSAPNMHSGVGAAAFVSPL